MSAFVLPRAAWILMLAAFGCGLLLHADRVPGWCLAVALIALGWQLLHQLRRVRMPGTVWRTLLALALLLATAATHRSLGGLAAGTTLLLAMGAAKLLEIRSQRDAWVMAMVALALLLAACLDRQSLPRVPLYLITGWVALAALAALSTTRESGSAPRALRTAGVALLWALPLAVLCFLFVPRLPGALWSFPPTPDATTGLSDEMSPGSISELSLSDEVAFRVRFVDAAPPPAQRYWRGPVLHSFDGYTWRRRPQLPSRQPVAGATPALHYQVMLEPTGQGYLFALDYPAEISLRGSRRLDDGELVSFRPITAAIDYDAASYLQLRATAPLSVYARYVDTALPPGRNPRSLALAQQLRAQSADERDYTRRVLRYFHDQGFQYTLTPPLLNQDSVDDLIFRTRLGFCGHFASAYVMLMRAAGIPARVVTGYLGGEWNPVGGYFVVRQSDAHAWAEVWLQESGWVRIDPTAVVAPARLNTDLRDMLPDTGSATARLLRNTAWARSLRDTWDAAANWWQQRVVNFNAAAQLDLLQKLGLPGMDYRLLALLLLGGAALWTLAVWWLARRHETGAARPDPLARVWLAFIALLQRRGLTIAAHEGPRAIAQRAAQQFPAMAERIAGFAGSYQHWRFGSAGAPPANVLSALRRELRWMNAASRAARR